MRLSAVDRQALVAHCEVCFFAGKQDLFPFDDTERHASYLSPASQIGLAAVIVTTGEAAGSL